MARATALQLVQVGKESVAGTAVACTTMFQSIGMEITPGGDGFTEQRAQGQRWTSVVVPGREWADVKLSGPLDYVEDTWLLLSLKRVAATTLASGAYSWVIAPSLAAEDLYNTYTLQQGTPQHGHRVTYAALKEYGISWMKDKAPERSGSMWARRLEDDIDLSTNEVQSITRTGTVSGGTYTISFGGQTTASIAYDATSATTQAALEALSTIGSDNVSVTGAPISGGPVYITFREDLGKTNVAEVTVSSSLTGGGTIAVATVTTGAEPTAAGFVPVGATHLDVYMADSWAGLAGASAETGVFKVDLKLSDFSGQKKVINSTYTSFAELVPKAFSGSLDVVMEADATGMALLTAMRAGTTKWIRVKAVGAQIGSTGYYYTYQVDGAFKVNKPNTFSDEDGAYAVQWSFTPVYDSVAGKAIEWTIYNATASV